MSDRLAEFEDMLATARKDEREKLTGWCVGVVGWTDYHDSLLLVRGLDMSIAHERHMLAGLPLDGLRYYRWRLEEAAFQLSVHEDWSAYRPLFEEERARMESKVAEILALRTANGQGDDLIKVAAVPTEGEE